MTQKLSSVYAVDRRGGKVLRITGFDLSKPGADWQGGGTAQMAWDAGLGGYRLVSPEGSNDPIKGAWTTTHALPLLPNRSYVLSALLNVDFPRPSEVNLGLHTVDGGGKRMMWHIDGIPNRTEGWKRWEWEITTDSRACGGLLTLVFYRFPVDATFQIADLAFVELPAKKLQPYGRGEGATFRGGPGSLPMNVEKVRASTDSITVTTTGAVYTFDLAGNAVLAAQRIGREREAAVWRPSLSLKGLEVLHQTDVECVLSNRAITFGVQCDSVVMVVPHQELALRCESKIAGPWNRLAAGHMLSRDEYGGWAANIDIPLGTGRLPRLDTRVEPGRVKAGELDFCDKEDDQNFLSEAKPGWQVSWFLSPGERIGLSVFPPRPFPWEDSFRSTFTISHSSTPVEKYRDWGRYADILILWNFTQRSWAMSWGRDFVPYDPETLRQHIAAAKEAGMRPIFYSSPYYYYSRDAQEHTDAVRRLKDAFELEGVYYDAVPSLEWVVAYEEMRMTRELFPSGSIILHATGHAYDGGPPLGEPSLHIPAVDTYADITYTGELVHGRGRDWVYPKYITSQYGLANCVGVMKHDSWDGLTVRQRDLMMLRHGGRACLLPVAWEGPTDEARMSDMAENYFRILEELKKLWEEKGSDPGFFEKYYLPRVTELSEPLISE
jgi:hypothetical protein